MLKQVIIAFVLLAAVAVGVRVRNNSGYQSASMIPTPTSSDMVQVQSGQRSTCTECGKVIAAHTHIETRTVPASEASKYSVMEIGEKCPECQARENERQHQQNLDHMSGDWHYGKGKNTIRFLLYDNHTFQLTGSPAVSGTWQQSAEGFEAQGRDSDKSSFEFSGQVIGSEMNIRAFEIQPNRKVMIFHCNFAR